MTCSMSGLLSLMSLDPTVCILLLLLDSVYLGMTVVFVFGIGIVVSTCSLGGMALHHA